MVALQLALVEVCYPTPTWVHPALPFMVRVRNAVAYLIAMSMQDKACITYDCV